MTALIGTMVNMPVVGDCSSQPERAGAENVVHGL
jgi:hypothetical protein